MTRVAVIALVLAGALIAVLAWVASDASERRQVRDRLLDEDPGAFAARRGKEPLRIPEGRPRTAGHVLVALRAPEDAPSARSGGRVLLSLRGNGVAFRRAGLTSAEWERHSLSMPAVEAVLERLAALPDTGGGRYGVIVDTGGGPRRIPVREEEAASLLEAVEGMVKRWVPDAVTLRVTPAPDAPDAPGGEAAPWPLLAALEPPEAYEEGAPLRAPRSVMRRVLATFEEHRLFEHEGRRWRLDGYTVELPP